MRRSCILVELIVVTWITLLIDNNSGTETIPFTITIKGKVVKKLNYCIHFEDIKYGNVAKGILRTSTYFLSERNGQFMVYGIRYDMDHKIYLNITHHCMPDDKRDMQKRLYNVFYLKCFMRKGDETLAERSFWKPHVIIVDDSMTIIKPFKFTTIFLKNCFMQVNHEIEGDPKTVNFELHNINLEAIYYQSNDVKCVDWPYKYPEFDKTDRSEL
ncbi:hypothetical protein LOAG_10139 [Loa loa]|uniref:ZP domain-containing protein n=1 Tax=Loa loa TaxID=7209 RepID=A0A1S0TQB4_LOALO|nr:hypothetical protein LOAG_10139 [Loa loa]EFO18354.1 hypothetical protein LOAG_10139 [Loa loa]